MLSRPTTEQILLDCRDQLLEAIAPAVAPGAAQIAVQMMENVLRNCATRAAHEIAWMREEGESLIAFAISVAESSCGSATVSAALDAYSTGVTSSLHLDDVARVYALASGCFEAALDAAMSAGHGPLTTVGRALLDARLAHEHEIMGEWTMVGRA